MRVIEGLKRLFEIDQSACPKSEFWERYPQFLNITSRRNHEENADARRNDFQSVPGFGKGDCPPPPLRRASRRLSGLAF
jgi:hypothetical protein